MQGNRRAVFFRGLSSTVLVGAVVSGGCTLPGTLGPALPARYEVVQGQLVLRSDSPLTAEQRLLEEMADHRGDLQEKLGLPPDASEPICVYLFERGEPYRAFLRRFHPELPFRRAFFLETATGLEVYAQRGDRVAEDLRHEVTHGYLHSVVPNLPVWLDEGLAEYAEVPRGLCGLNQAHLERLQRRLAAGDWPPDLARLEALEPTRDLSQDDYAESWAWAHFLLEGPAEGRTILREYLQDLRRSGSAKPISVRLRRSLGRPEQALAAYVERLGGSNRHDMAAGSPAM